MSVRVIQRRYGGPEVLEAVPLDRPRPQRGEVLVRIRAAGLNPVDVKTRAGGGIAGMLQLPLALGWDAAGVVAEVGDGVVGFEPGDRVYGMPLFPRQAGTFASYIVSPEGDWAHAPKTLDDVQAAAVPLAALTALKAFREVAHLGPGQRVLVHGAGGGVGHFAVQIATILGAVVVATASSDKEVFVKGLGADTVIDYRATDFREALAEQPVDVVLDLIGGETSLRSVEVLKPGGLVIAVPAGADEHLRTVARDAGVRAESVMVSPNGPALEEIAGWIDDGRLEVVVSEVFGLADLASAHRFLESGHVRGKVVVQVP